MPPIPGKTKTENRQLTWFRLDWVLTLALFAGALSLYLRTLAPELLGGDSGELQFAAWRFGLAHPTGYPLYLLMGGTWQRLWAAMGVSPATALNAFSAVTGAVAVSGLYAVMVRWLPGNKAGRGRAAALFTSLLFAANPTFWSQNLIAEVYALNALFIIGIFIGAQSLAGSQTPKRALLVFGLAGLALTHHRTSLFILPGLGLVYWLWDRSFWKRPATVFGILAALALPQLLYLYIPLRSGPDASPWLYQRLDGDVLALYDNSWRGFQDFVTGKVFAVSFLGWDGAIARVTEAWHLWLVHFTWPGLLLVLLGLACLVRQRSWTVLLLTGPMALLLQIFNLFYGIGDIYVFYIPLYLTGAIWAGFGAWWAISSADRMLSRFLGTARSVQGMAYILMTVVLAALPAFLLVTYFPQVDRSEVRQARATWEQILAAGLPADAMLISNDRDEIVPLYYLQAVEGRAPGLTGLFPLITQEPRFADVGMVTETALTAGGDRPVYFIKPMPGMDVKFELAPGPGPLVQALGPAVSHAPSHLVQAAYGPLVLLGYDWVEQTDGVMIVLYWQVRQRLAVDYTTTVQLFDAAGNKLAQNDGKPGGAFYPTSLWKIGEVLRDAHLLSGVGAGAPVRLLVAMYTGPDLALLAPPLTVELR
jgi:hypothetical protein